MATMPVKGLNWTKQIRGTKGNAIIVITVMWGE